MMDQIDVYEEPGLSPDDGPSDPDAPQPARSWLWAGAAMLAVVGTGVAISTLSERYAEQAADDRNREITSTEAADMCRESMRDIGIDRFTVPTFVGDEAGGNQQASRPWRIGTTVKVLPHRGFVVGNERGILEPQRIVLCTLGAD